MKAEVMIKVTIELDDEEFFLAEYLAEVAETTVEQAAKDALMDKVRQLYEESQKANKIKQAPRESEDADDIFMDEDR